MTFTNLEKYVYSKKVLKTTTSTLLPLSPAKSKVFSRRKSHLATAVICNWVCLSSRQSNKTFPLSFTLKGCFLQPGIRKTIQLKVPSFWTIITIIEYVELKWVVPRYDSSISTNIAICINNFDPAVYVVLLEIMKKRKFLRGILF